MDTTILDVYANINTAEDFFLKQYTSKNTQRTYLVAFRNFEDFLDEKGLEFYEVTSDIANEFLQWLINPDFQGERQIPSKAKKPSVANDMARKMKTFYEFIIYITKERKFTKPRKHPVTDKMIEPITLNPFERVKYLNTSRLEYPDKLELNDIFDAIDNSVHDAVKAGLLLCAFAGLRASEPSKIAIDNIFMPYNDPDGKQIKGLAEFRGVDYVDRYRLWKFRIISSKRGQNRETFFILPSILQLYREKVMRRILKHTNETGENRFFPKMETGEFLIEPRKKKFGKDIKKHIVKVMRENGDLQVVRETRQIVSSHDYKMLMPDVYPDVVLSAMRYVTDKTIAGIVNYYSSLSDVQEVYADFVRVYDLIQFLLKRIKYTTKTLHYDYPFKVSPEYMRAEIYKYIQPEMEKKFHVHALRHFYATYLASKGISLLAISKYLGHANVTTTQIYINETADEIMEREEEKLYR